MKHKLRGHVLSICTLLDEDGEVCAPGDRGRVEYLDEDGMPLVRFERTGRASLVDGDTEIVAVRAPLRTRA
jgi:hypothetical protein